MRNNVKTTIETESGKLDGSYLDGIYVFKGVPYAAPPVGERRWLLPEPVEAWSGVRPAREYGATAPQNEPALPVAAIAMVEQPQDEDCLFLNIWTPGLDNGRRPVMVWIHGGAFNMGSGSNPMYEGDALSKRGGVVVVTINYRLGVLGFLNLNEITGGVIPATGNEGLLDQVAALKWVKENILSFGGDPDNVTVFGESAGGMSIGFLMAMSRAKGLFEKGILQSGVGNTAIPLEAAMKTAELFLKVVDIGEGNYDRLRSLTVEQLLAAQLEMITRRTAPGSARGLTQTVPVIDGTVIPELPIEAVKRGVAGDIPVIIGSTLDESKLLTMMDMEIPKLDEAGLLRRCRSYVPSGQAEGLVRAYRDARVRRGEDTSPPEIFRAVNTDQMFRIPGIRLAEAQRLYNKSVYRYLFTWKSPVLGGSLGACHTLDIGFVFDKRNEMFHGLGPASDDLSRKMQDAWAAFARRGNPSCESIGEWPGYGDDKETMILGEKCLVVNAPYEEERIAWETAYA